jgi:hypothetical protein
VRLREAAVSAPALAVTDPDGFRRYHHPRTGEVAPSVTSVIKVIAKPELDAWKARKAAEYMIAHEAELGQLHPLERARQIRDGSRKIADDAADIGNAVHDAIDASAKGQPFPITKGTNSYLDRFVEFIMDRQPRWIENEVTLWSRSFGYAGTADWIADIDGHIYLGDTKTGKKVYEEAALQLSALAGCDFIIREDGSEEEIPPLDFLAALHVRPRSWKLIPVNRRQENLSCFLAAREILRWQEECKPTVLGNV